MRIQQIEIGTLGSFPITMPVMTVGTGKPRIVLVTGLHGGEESGVLLQHDLLQALPEGPGTLVLLPSAHPLTQAFKARFSPTDGMNPNRVFPGSSTGDLSSRVARKTMEVIGNADLVIDLHCYTQNCPLTGVFVSGGSTTLQQYVRSLLQKLDLDVIWKTDATTPDDGVAVGASLSGALMQRGIPSFSLEMPRADHLSDALRKRVVQGLLRLIEDVRTGRQRHADVPSRIPEIRVLEVRADASGFFLPAVEPLTTMNEGSVLGSLIHLVSFETTLIKSRASGLLFLINRPGIVTTGSKLYSVGLPA